MSTSKYLIRGLSNTSLFRVLRPNELKKQYLGSLGTYQKLNGEKNVEN